MNDQETFENPRTPEEWSHNAKVVNARLDALIRKWDFCQKANDGHRFAVVGDDGTDAVVWCIACGYGCMMPIDKTKDMPEYWEAFGKQTGMLDFTMAARAIVDEIESKEATTK